jgi:DNA-binding transcriptional MerR regulator
MSPNRPLRSGELARLAGVSADTVRHYERRGLLPAALRSASGYRLFPAEALLRVRVIRGALAIGFSVKELGAIFGERDGGGTPCNRVRKMAAEKLVELEARIHELQSWREELRGTLAEWDRLLGQTPRGRRAGLLEAFVATHPTCKMRSERSNAQASGNHRREKQR